MTGYEADQKLESLTSILNNNMELEKKTKGKHGGAREGCGRPKGSGTKLTAEMILKAAEAKTNKPFAESLIEDWHASLGTPDRVKYNNLILNKVIADRHQVEVDESSTMENRQEAFLKALEAFGSQKMSFDNHENSEGN